MTHDCKVFVDSVDMIVSRVCSIFTIFTGIFLPVLFAGGKHKNRRQPLQLLQLCELKQRQSAETCRSASIAGDQEPLKLQSDRNNKKDKQVIHIKTNSIINSATLVSSPLCAFPQFPASKDSLRFFGHFCHLVRGLSTPSRED